MVDPKQVGKKSANYEQWTKEQSDALLELMVDAAIRGWRDNSGILSRTTVEERILPVLNEKLGCNKTFKNYQSRLRWFKGRWISYSTLMRFSSGFGYDPSTKRFTANNEVWDEYLKAHPNDTDLRYGTYEDYENLEIAIGNGVAVGKNSIGLGSDVIDARTFVVGEGREVCIEDFAYDVENEAFVGPMEDTPSAHPITPVQSPENLEIPRQGTTQRKRSRAEYEGENANSTRGTPQSGVMEKLDKLSSGFDTMIALLEKRDRQSKIWDAIKEIPNLDNATCYTALELLDTKTKKDAFFNMTPQERSDWIFHKMGRI